MEPVGLKSYMLIRVGLDVKEETWFGLGLEQEKDAGEQGEPRADRANVPEERKVSGTMAASKERKAPGTTAAPEERKAPGTMAAPEERKTPGSTAAPEKNVVPAQGAEIYRSGGAGAGEKPPGRKERMRKRWAHPLGSLRQALEHRKDVRQEARRREAEKLERERAMARHKERIRQADLAIEKLAAEVMELTEEPENCRCVYEGAVRKALLGRQGAEAGQEAELGVPGRESSRGFLERERTFWDAPERPRSGQELPWLWHKHFDMEEFKGYKERFWVERLMPYARLHHYVVLGTAPCVYEILEAHARRMKSLRWILLEADCTQELQDFVEDFYTEYGLAIELQTAAGTDRLKRLRLVCDPPANIMDFTGEIFFGTAGVAEGSVWLDMLSSDEKRYRIAGRRGGIGYFSLKEEWKRAQRRCREPYSHEQ